MKKRWRMEWCIIQFRWVSWMHKERPIFSFYIWSSLSRQNISQASYAVEEFLQCARLCSYKYGWKSIQMHENIAHSLGWIMAALLALSCYLVPVLGLPSSWWDLKAWKSLEGCPYSIQFLLILHDPRVLWLAWGCLFWMHYALMSNYTCISFMIY